MNYSIQPVKYLPNFVVLARLNDGRVVGQQRVDNLNLYLIDREGNKTLLWVTSTGFLKGLVLPSGTLYPIRWK